MKKYLFDMDGVLADWDLLFEEKYGKVSDYSEDEFQDLKKALSESSFYLDLKPIPEGINLFLRKKAEGEVAILTSAGKYNTDEVARQKMQWLVDNLGFLPEFYYTKGSKDKAAYSDMGVLIDDRMKSVKPFRDAGGEAILFDRNDFSVAA